MINLEKLIEELNKRKIVTSRGCWIIDITPNDSGYLRLGLNNERFRINRVSCAYYHGLNLDDPKQLALHKNECNNRKCWNPDHLYIGTYADNNVDSIKNGRVVFGGGINKDKIYCPYGHLLDGMTKNNKRYCKECNRQRANKYYKNSNKCRNRG